MSRSSFIPLIVAIASSCSPSPGDGGSQQPRGRDAGDEADDSDTSDKDSEDEDDSDTGSDDRDGSTDDPDAPCESMPGEDRDKDGFKAPQDCNDCDPLVNPGAYDIAGNKRDDDCSGKSDNEVTECDKNVSLSSEDPLDAARTIGLCKEQEGDGWGLVSARWTFPDGTVKSISEWPCPKDLPPHELAHSVLAAYGSQNTPIEGKKLLALASGWARPGTAELDNSWSPAEGMAPVAVNLCVASAPPKGFPAATPSCPAPSRKDLVFDGIALELEIRVPTNANALNFAFNFISPEFPAYVCQGKNDQFVALLDSEHSATPADQNISFDSKGNPLSVDASFLEVCEPGTLRGRTFTCPRGIQSLQDTGIVLDGTISGGEEYIRGGATSWLNTTAPVVPGETIKLRLAIWDTDDPTLDSIVLLDSFKWTFEKEEMETPVTDFILF